MTDRPVLVLFPRVWCRSPGLHKAWAAWALLAGCMACAADPVAEPPPAPAANAPDQPPATQSSECDRLILSANRAYLAGQYVEARQHVDQLLVRYQQLYPESQYPAGHAHVIMAYVSLCQVCCAQKDYAQVAKSGEAGVRMCRALHPHHDDAVTARCEVQLHFYVATAYYTLDDLRSSRQHCEQAIEAGRTLLADDPGGHVRAILAKCYETLAAVSLQEGDWLAADAHWTRALTELQFRLKLTYDIGDQRTLAHYLASQSNVLRLLGKYQKALALAQESHAISLRVFLVSRDPQDDSDAIQMLINQGVLLRLLGNMELAHSHFQSIRHRLQVGDNGDGVCPGKLNVVLHNLIMISGSQGAVDELRVYRDALRSRFPPPANASFETRSGSCDVELLRGLGFAFRETGDYALAEQYLKHALALASQSCNQVAGTPTDYDVIVVRHELAVLYGEVGSYEESYVEYAESLRVANRLFPVDRFPHGHPLLTGVMRNMATQCWLVGETDAAADLYHQVVLMNESLFPDSDYAEGHLALEQAYTEWSEVLMREKRFGEAEEYANKAHDMILRRSRVKAGIEIRSAASRDLTNSFVQLARLHRAQADYDAARRFLSEALSSYESRCCEGDSEGQLSIALTLAELGRTSAAEGDFPAALEYHRRSVAIRRTLFPAAQCPDGHPVLANALRDLGITCLDAGESVEAFHLLAESVGMEHAIGESFFGGGSEAQLLNLAARKFQSLGPLLQASTQVGLPPDQVYPHAWLRHGFVPQLIADRQRALRELARDTAPGPYEKYVAMRRDLARILLVSLTDNAEHNAVRVERIRQLNASKDELERQLTHDLESTQLGRHAARDVQALVKLLPERSVFVDFLVLASRPYDATMPTRSDHHAADQMVAFVLSRHRPIALVDVGDPNEIAVLVTAWNDELSANSSGNAGVSLRQRIWDPVQRHFPDDVETVYIAPDGAVAQVAWSALPCPADAGVLLEHFAIATVPHGRFLLEQLQRSHESPAALSTVLAVGDVDYGDPHEVPSGSPRGMERWRWPRLAGSRRELEAIATCGQGRQLTVLTGAEATTENVLRALPTACVTHLATHGFFLDDQIGRTLELAGMDRGSARLTLNQTRSSVLSRSPLLRSGLALAGANRQLPGDEWGVPTVAPAFLTAESIAALDGSRLQLVVLSACDTTRGDAALGDGVLGMQTAFHIAGARNVIAGLWKVSDEATATLMTDFYRRLWVQHRTPLAALREAQLSMLYHTRPSSTAPRGLDLDHTVPLNNGPAPKPEPSRLHVRDWAGFVLSGPGF